MRYWQAVLVRGEATWTLGVQADSGPHALKTVADRVGYDWLPGTRITIREILQVPAGQERRDPGAERLAL